MQKQRVVWRLTGGICGEGAAILLRLWESLGLPEQVSGEAGAVTRYGVRSITKSFVSLANAH